MRAQMFYVKVKGLFILPDELSTLGYFDLDPHWVLLYWGEGGGAFKEAFFRIFQENITGLNRHEVE